MNRRVLSLLSVIAILAVMLSLGACKPKDPESDGNESAVPGKDNLAGTTVKLYTWGDSGISDDERARLDWIEETYGIKTQYIRISYGQMDMKYVLDISADNAPDLVYLTDERFPRYIVKGLCQPLEKYPDVVNTDSEYWKLVLEKSPFKWRNETYGMCTGVTPYWLWYNKTMFEENDVKTPIEYYKEGNWTFETLADCANKLTADTDGDGVVDRYGFMSWKTEALVVANGGSFFEFQDDGTIRVALKDQPTINALQYVQDGGFKNKWFCYNSIDWVQGFVSERLAMTLETTWFRNEPASKVKFEVDFVPMPVGPDNKTGATLGFATSQGLCTGSKNPYGALKWMEANYEYYQMMSKQEGTVVGQYDHLYTDEQRERIKSAKDMEWEAGFLYGVGDMAGLMNNLFYGILSGTPVATVVDQQMDVFQHEVDVTMKDSQLPEVLPFDPPPRLDFESDDYLQHIVFEDETGELFGIQEPVLTTDPDEAIDGTSLKFAVEPEEAFQLFRFADAYTFPAYHTYTISFDYRMLEDMDDGGRFLIAICPKDSTVGGPHKASVGLTNLMAGDTGTFTMDMDVYEYGDPQEFTLAFVGINAGSVVIDNFQVKDVSAQ